MFARSLIRWFVFVVVGGWSAVASAEDQPQLVLDAGGHTNTVWKLAFANNGRELVTVSDDKSLRVWDLATGESLRVLRPPIAAGDVGQLRAVAVSPVGDLLAMAGYTLDDAIYLVSLATGRLKQTLRGHENVTLAVAFSPDGALLGSANADHTARLWNVKTGECVHVLAGHAPSSSGSLLRAAGPVRRHRFVRRNGSCVGNDDRSIGSQTGGTCGRSERRQLEPGREAARSLRPGGRRGA